ncbi:MAG TPA: excinuclease ABC subunit UvrC [Gemmatimonadaceae bacterium]|nr:excinuclease ABC subunit UvrC [Gemmatimonadaceae bacterium]
MIAPPDALAAKLDHLPDTPGVYLWKGADGEVLYVGKANSLRSRVRSYLSADREAAPKTHALMRLVVDLETIVVPSEAHALILEANLIKEHRPRFNILLRDDKTYPFIKVTVQEPFPRVFVTRRVLDDGARYFGPYTDVGSMRRALNVVKRIFTVRSCSYHLPHDAPARPCLDYFIKRCKAPCVGWQSESDYRAMIDEVVVFLDGRSEEVVKRVRERMMHASDQLDYERAAELRDALRRLEQMEEPTTVLDVGGGDRDVLGYARDGDDACVALLRIRRGKLLAREHRFLENIGDGADDAVLATYLTGSYLTLQERGAEVLLPFDVPDHDVMQQALTDTRMRVPQRGPRRELLDLAEQNARHLLEELKLAVDEADERAADPVYDLGRELGLQRIPRSLVCFDISTTQGTDTVASVVWFENGRPKRSEYRTLRIKTVEGTDDFASMREAVSRYFVRRENEHKPRPELLVVDGGKGQLGAAATALGEAGVADLPLISLAKRDEDVFVRGRAEPLRLSRRSPALRLLQQARDEAHRVAVTYNRKRRTMRTVTSELLSIPGVGPAKRRALLAKFGSLQGVREASVEAIAAVPGFSAVSAQRVLDKLNAVNEPSPEIR